MGPSAAPDALFLGVDLGGTKIEIVALDAKGREHLRRRIATPAGDYQATLDAVAALVADAESALAVPLGATRVGIGTPGSISRATGLLRGSNSTCLNGQPLRADFERKLARPIAIANDANCFALSEAKDGAAAGAGIAFAAILGTGVGAGIAIDGRVLEGANAIAGEWGHNPLPWPTLAEHPGPRCWCGRVGCIETFLSGRGMERDHREATGETAAASDIAARAAAGDAACAATLERYEDRLARALAHVINLVDPEVIVLGGGMSNVARLYANVPQRFTPWVFSDRIATRLVPNRHGDSSGVRGAAWLAAQALAARE